MSTNRSVLRFLSLVTLVLWVFGSAGILADTKKKSTPKKSSTTKKSTTKKSTKIKSHMFVEFARSL